MASDPPRIPLRLLIGGIVAVTVLGFWGCSKESDPWKGAPSPHVVVSFPPLYSFAKGVAGDSPTIKCLLQKQGPHDYQYESRDVLLLRGADLFLVNGLDLDDPFTDRMKDACANPRLKYVKLGERIPKQELHKEGHEEHEGHAGHHHHGDIDPHVWLGLPQAIAMVEAAKDALKDVDPAQAAGYDGRAKKYTDELKELHAYARKALGGKQVKLVTMHESLHYFVENFETEEGKDLVSIVGAIQVTPGQETDQGHLAKLAELCVKNKVRIIAVEPQYPESSAKELVAHLQRSGVDDPQLVVIDPLETYSPDDGDLDAGWYVRKMRQNIDNLAKAVK